jgi:hypothetical protein
MGGNNTLYYDTTGDFVRDTAVDDYTTSGKQILVMLWVCRQADSPTSGMAVAWTHRTDFDSNGYGSGADSGRNCFIGFSGGSPGISDGSQSFLGYTYPAKYFIQKFYYYMLDPQQRYSVSDALNIASGEFFGLNYEDSPLDNGYYTYWPYNPTFPDINASWYPGAMHVYGNGNLKLYQPLVTLSANNGLSPTFTINGQSYSTGSHRLQSPQYDVFTFNVGDVSGYHFNWLLSNNGYYPRPANFQIAQDRTITALYTQDYIHLLDGTGGYTDPSSGWYYGSGGRYITAYANSGYHFVEWRLNGNYLSSDPTVYANYGANTVLPVFDSDEPEYYSINIRGWEDVYCTEIYPDIYLNGDYYGTCEIQDTLEEGYYTFTADQYYDQFVCYYVVVTDGGQWMEWGNSVQIYLSTDTTLDFYYTG